MAAYPSELICSNVLILNPARRYCSRKFWSSGDSLPKKVSLKLPSILSPQTAQDIAVVCIERPQEGHDDDNNFLAIIINISPYSDKVKKNLGKIKKILKLFDTKKYDSKNFCGYLQQNRPESVKKLP